MATRSDSLPHLFTCGRALHVAVGSGNEAKIEAVRRALASHPVQVSLEGRAVESGVPEQPVGFEEIARGARQRARAAFALGGCDLSVGIEDGLVLLNEVHPDPFNIGCAAIFDGEHESLGLSSAFAYPLECARPALEHRSPIGDLFDALWRARTGEADSAPSGRGIGNVGKLTNGALDRGDYARHAVQCALVRFLHPDLYFPP